tara:strand:+ start:5109 stop:5270 length:162 start_codon:yes stop_codon:yes gene_type:complete
MEIVLYTDGAFRYDDLENYTVPMQQEIYNSIKKKNDEIKESMDRAKGTRRKTF